MVGNFQEVKIKEKLFFGEELSFIGLPGGSISLFRPVGKVGITIKSKEPDGAWSFLKFMMDERRDTYNIFFPVKLANLEAMAKEAETGGPRKYSTYMPGGVIGEYEIESNSAADSAKVMELILSTEKIRQRDFAIKDIISEEIDAYLYNQKSVDDVINIIESRINLYISESD
jgi:ABC-type glycerol-3-phosphate transport system substrate-binding protein